LSDKLFTLNRPKLKEGTKRILIYCIVILVGFILGAAIVGGIVASNHNKPHKDLQTTSDFVRKNVIDSFTANVYDVVGSESISCEYTNPTGDFNYLVPGYVEFIEYHYTNPEYEIIRIGFTSTGFYFEDITFIVKDKIRLDVIIFVDGEIEYTNTILKKEITLDFSASVESIELYFF